MITTLHTEWTVGDVCKGFIFDKNEGKGLFGLDGQLIIQPEYQRNYIYGDGKRDVAVVESLLKKEAEMDADHVTAWSKGGATDIKNCQMLCRTHNHAKGNR